MNTPRIKTSSPKDEPISPVWIADHDWIREHQAELREQYGECWVVVYQKQVIGTGAGYAAAIEDAENKLPPTSPVITPVVESIQKRPPFLRFLPLLSPAENDE